MTDAWKEFEQNPVTHSAAHHLVAILELRTEYGYARVSDVARLLEITRGSASITLKGLKQRGLVTEDERRFLGLSSVGEKIARSVIARKTVMKKLFMDVLGVDESQADIDTCKIEHLISNETAKRAVRFLRYFQSGDRVASEFVDALQGFDESCALHPEDCPCCEDVCLVTNLREGTEQPGKAEPNA